MIEYLVSGTLFGLAAGFGPGPLMTLVISESLQGGTRAGMKVALAPLVTDPAIVLVTLVLVGRISGFDTVLAVISICGAAVVLALGVETIRARVPEVRSRETHGHALKRGALVNALNPHPYLFWIVVGAPTVYRADAESGVAGVIAFVVGMYVCLVGGKMAVSFIVGRSRRFISRRVYRFIMVTLGLLLLIFAVTLLFEGLRGMGWFVTDGGVDH
ncbi:MAG: LysE family translocator [Candidatus Krumholzibacteriota bacterium]|nr:LysE family translocator [Candidatus Krumholzibacteriota bacterium]